MLRLSLVCKLEIKKIPPHFLSKPSSLAPTIIGFNIYFSNSSQGGSHCIASGSSARISSPLPDSNSAENELNAGFEDALVVVGNTEMPVKDEN